MVMRLPILLVLCFAILFYYLRWSFLAGCAVFALSFFFNTKLSQIQARLQKAFMSCKDARVKAITESLNNIKMLKLYSWKEIFYQMIVEKREQELEVLRKRFRFANVMVTSLYFFPSLLSAVLFSVYIALGNTLDLDIAFTVMTILNLIKGPLRSLPSFIGQLIEFQVSMTRIQEFILVSEVNPAMIRNIPQEEAQDSITIREGSNFHWGSQTEKEKQGKKLKDVKQAVEHVKRKNSLAMSGNRASVENESLMSSTAQQ